MAKIKLAVTDARLLEALEELKERGTVASNADFCRTIGIYSQNITNIRAGKQRFVVKDIEAACKAYNLNPNWLFGYSEDMFLKKAAIHFISEAKASNKKANSDRKLASKRS